MGAEVHDEGADDAEDGVEASAIRDCAVRELMTLSRRRLDPGGEDVGLALLGVVALDDADAAEGFGEAAGDLGVDLGALAEDGADGLEGPLEDEAEDEEDAEGEQCHPGADANENAEGDDGGEDAADEFEQAGADEVADAFDVGHDAGDEGAGAVFVVEGDGEAADVGLDLPAQLGDEALACCGEQLGEGVGGEALDEGRGERRLR